MDSPLNISGMVREIVNDDFAVIAFVTFFVCEAIFNALPMERARMKQLTSIVIGGILGILLLDAPSVDGFLQGLLAGGATTIAVAKFKKPSAAPVAILRAPVAAESQEPAEHI